MTPERCPGCGTKLTPDMRDCPNCPLSFSEEERRTPADAIKNSRCYDFLLPAAFFAALGAGVWYMAVSLFHLGKENAQVETSSLFRDKGSTDTLSIPAAGTPSVPESEGDVSVEQAGGASSGGETLVVAAAPTRAVKLPREWRLRGAVYDLATLAPVAGCDMEFKDEATNKIIRSRTDSSGRYRAVVPPLVGRGYAVKVLKDGYAPNYLNPGTAGVREMDASQRASLAKDVAASLTSEAASVQPADEKPLVTDFYLAPKR